jgi:hypothetical protein
LKAGQYCAISNNHDTDNTSVPVSFAVGPAPPPTVAPVGGVVMPANTFALVAPWLAVIGLVGCIGVVGVVVKRHRA